METQSYDTMVCNRLKLVREPDQVTEKVKISSSDAMNNWCRQFWKDEDMTIYESFFVGYLNNSNQTIGWHKISQGGVTGTVVDVRLIAKGALDTLATSIICAHNHPSGNLKPSNADIQLTNKLRKGLAILDIKLLDHLIITSDGYHSMSDENDI
jgi:DNA repair protein RadC